MKHSHLPLCAASRLVVCLLFTLVIPATAFAHTALTEAMPGDGAMVKQGPAHINLTFNGLVKLVKLELMGVGHEMPTNFESNSEAKNAFMIETPGMHPGAFTVNWAVIGEDGHTVADSYSFTVDPSITEEHTGESVGNSH